ncbi:hypothetical protein HanPI659440_Chr04g0165171 [Helianthus annuus]|nr:hypothetical protein HanPI659440_Chr04g0165171 [Helianthus annuus]
MLSGRPSKADIPKCSSCGSDRAFEFQVLYLIFFFTNGFFRCGKFDPFAYEWVNLSRVISLKANGLKIIPKYIFNAYNLLK